jgi:tetratricopeptide (TPR) repeat protein
MNLENNSFAANVCMSYPNAGAYLPDLRLHPQRKIAWLEKAVDVARIFKDRNMEGVHLGNLGNAYADLGDAKKAIEYYEKHLVIAREIGDRRGEGNALWNMNLSLDKLGQRAKAIDCAKSSLKIYEQIESPTAERVRQTLAEWLK